MMEQNLLIIIGSGFVLLSMLMFFYLWANKELRKCDEEFKEIVLNMLNGHFDRVEETINERVGKVRKQMFDLEDRIAYLEEKTKTRLEKAKECIALCNKKECEWGIEGYCDSD